MKRSLLSCSLASVALLSLSVLACSNSFDTAGENSDPEEVDDGDKASSNDEEDDPGLGGSGPGDEPEEVCDPEALDLPDDDFEDANCDGIDGDVEGAIFVAPSGDDSAAGSLEEPVATLNAAIALAQDQDLDVYVCNAEYPEQVRLEEVAVNIYAGYDCEDDWKRVADRAVVNPAAGSPLTILSADGATFERIWFRAAAATEFGVSSIAARVQDSEDVTFRRVEFEAGRAGVGITGDEGVPAEEPALKGADGDTCSGTVCSVPGLGGASTPRVTCADGSFAFPGGTGGHGVTTLSGRKPGTMSHEGGAPGVGANEDGGPGTKRSDGDIGVLGDEVIGSFIEGTYVPGGVGGEGTWGLSGTAGGGGAGGICGRSGGSASTICIRAGSGGGQGGSAGCGGAPGQGGGGGGASVGLVLVRSTVELAWSRIVTGDGGRGGRGGRGAVGQEGGAGGLPGWTGDYNGSGAGGKGGDGGRGGDGAPGVGGPSLGIALVDSDVPDSSNLQILLGSAGMGGAAEGGLTAADGLAAEGYDFTSGEEVSF